MSDLTDRRPDSLLEQDLRDRAESAREQAITHLHQGNPAALEPAQEAVEILRELAGPRDSKGALDLANALLTLAQAQRQVGQFDPAIAAGEEAADLLRRGVAQDADLFAPHLASCLNNLASFYRAVRNFERRIAAVEEAVAIRRDLVKQDRRRFLVEYAMGLNTLTITLAESGRLEEALAQALEAEKLGDEVNGFQGGDEDWAADYAGIMINAANLLVQLGRATDAMSRIRNIVRIYAGLAKTKRPAALCDYGLALNNLAATLEQVHRQAPNEEAVDAAGAAVEIFRELAADNPGGFLPDYANALHTFVNALSNQGRLDAALSRAHDLVETYRHLTQVRPAAFLAYYARALATLGNRYCGLAKRAEAEQKFLEARGHFERLPALIQESLLEDMLKLYLNMGGMYREEDAMLGWPHYQAAREMLRRARGVAERFEGRLQNSAYRQRIRGQWMVAHELLVATCVDLADTTDDPKEKEAALREAVEVTESSRARQLRELMAENEVAPQCDPALWEDYLAAKRELREAEEQEAMEWMRGGAQPMTSRPLAGIRGGNGAPGGERGPDFGGMTGDTEAAATVEDDPSTAPAQARLSSLLEEIRRHHPGFVENEPLPAATFQDLRTQLPGDGSRALVQFFLTSPQSQTASIALVTHRDKTFPVRLPNFTAADGWNIASEWHALVNAGPARGETLATPPSRPLSARLPAFIERVAQTIVAPLWEALEQQGIAHGLRSLVVSPHLALNFLPLHACPLPHTDQLLGEVVEISYAPSLTQHLRCAQREAPADGDELVTANPTEDLVFSELEVAALRERYPTASILHGEDVRRETLLQRLGQAGAWFYTGHAIHRRDRPLDSAFVLSDDLRADHWLTLRDIFTRLRLRPGAGVVVLGCQTAYFSPDPADEPTSLATGLLFAGARYVVSTLWPVNDLSCALWSDRFHAEIQRGVSVAVAVREAGRWLRGDPRVPDSIRSGSDLLTRVLPPLLARLDPTLELLTDSQGGGGTEGRDPVNALESCKLQAGKIAARHPASAPFASPYHWAPFVVAGAA